MTRKLIFAMSLIALLAVAPAFAGPATGCNKIKFNGTYTSPDLNRDIFGDTSSVHSLVFQLTLHSDGTASQFWTGLPDYIMNAGTGSAQIGSWTCRADGKLVVTLIQGAYFPVDSTSGNPNILTPDIELIWHFRTTYLFSVNDENTLTKLQSRTRRYVPSENPTDPAAGELRPINTATAVYKRLTATDADLLAAP